MAPEKIWLCIEQTSDVTKNYYCYFFVIVIIIISAKWTKWMAENFCSMCVCLSVCARSGPVNQTDQFKTVKATDFKFDVHVPRDSPDMTP